MAIIMNGNKLARKIKTDIAEKTSKMENKVGLAVIMVGDDPASSVYVTAKKRDCKECGIKTFDYSLPSITSEADLRSLINLLNNTDYVDGILIQLPLPSHIDSKRIISSIRPSKDVDGLHKANMGSLMLGRNDLVACTPSGIMRLLEEYNIDVAGKKCVIINKSDLLGKPLSMLLLNKNATVTMCHSHTKNVIEECRSADILITATGGGLYITSDYIKEGAVVIDASTNRDENGNLCGDVIVDDNVYEKVSYVTPVPGGVGPMTRAMLMQNTLIAATVYHNKK